MEKEKDNKTKEKFLACDLNWDGLDKQLVLYDNDGYYLVSLVKIDESFCHCVFKLKDTDNDRWSINIERAGNGYIVTPNLPWGDGEVAQVVVHEMQDTKLGHLIAMQDLLHSIKNYFGVIHQKHNKDNLVIDIEDEDGNKIH